MHIAAVYRVVLVSCLLLNASGSGADERPPRALPGWIDEVQTYCMVPVLPERAAQLHATINGVWGGMGGTHPILTHTESVPAVQAKYGRNGLAFVDICRKAGLVAVGTVNGLEGFETMRPEWPDLDAMACRDAEDRPSRSDDGMTLMCTNNPDWVQWELEFGQRAIALGAELVNIDTPMSSSFIAGFLGGGFCDCCMETFENDLRSRFTEEALGARFDLHGFDEKEIVSRLSAFQFTRNPLRRAFVEDSADGLVCAFPIMQPERKRIVVHLVNYDIDHGADRIRARVDLPVIIPRPPFVSGPVRIRVYLPGADDTFLPAEESGEEEIAFCLGRLEFCASVVISSAD